MRRFVGCEQAGDLHLGGQVSGGRRRLEDLHCAAGADQEPRDGLGGSDRGGEAQPGRVMLAASGEPFQRHGQVSASLGRDQGVNLVDDDLLDGARKSAASRAG